MYLSLKTCNQTEEAHCHLILYYFANIIVNQLHR